MQFFILPTLLAIATTVSAGCYGGGDSWGNERGLSQAAVDRICKREGIAGNYAQSQTKYHCEQVNGNRKSQFWVKWNGGGPALLSDEECKFRLKNEVGGCKNGGESNIGQWYFR